MGACVRVCVCVCVCVCEIATNQQKHWISWNVRLGHLDQIFQYFIPQIQGSETRLYTPSANQKKVLESKDKDLS